MKHKGAIFVIFLCILLTVSLGEMVIKNHESQSADKEKIAGAKSQIQEYQNQIEEIETEMSEKQAELTITNETGIAVVAFRVTDAVSTELAETIAAEYSFAPILLIDTSLDEETLTEILKDITPDNYEIILTGSSDLSTCATQKKAFWDLETTVRQTPENYWEEQKTDPRTLTDTGCYLLNSMSDTVIESLSSAGFTGCIYPSEVVYTSDNTTFGRLQYTSPAVSDSDIQTQLDDLVANHGSKIFIFTVKGDGEKASGHDAKSLRTNINLIQDQVNQGNLVYGTVKNTMQTELDNLAATQQQQADYDLYFAEKESEMEELQQKMKDVYNQW